MIMMKKLIPLALMAGAAAGYAIYKLKKANDKKIIELDEALLEDELLEEDEPEIKIFDLSDKIEEAVQEEDDDDEIEVEIYEVKEPTEEVEEAVEVAETTVEEATEEVEEASSEAKTEDEYDEIFVNLKKKIF